MNNRELTKKLKELKGLEAAGTPEQGWILSNRQVLMNQISPKSEIKESSREFGSAVYYFQYFGQFFNQRVLKPAAITLAVFFVLISYTATVSVADASLPGDTLYPIKTTRERVKLAFTFKEEEKVKLQMDYVSRRVDELQGLVAQDGNESGKSEDVASTAQKISDDIKSIKDSLNRITTAATNGDALEVAKDIDSKTLAVGHGLEEIKGSFALTVNIEAINEAIDDTEEAGTAALVVIINKFEEGNSGNITDDELVSRVAERIKNVENNIQSIVDDEKMSIGVEMLVNIENDVVSSTTSFTEEADISAIDTDVSGSDSTQIRVDEAKDLLNKNEYGLAIERLMQVNNNLEIETGEVRGEYEEADVATTTEDTVDTTTEEDVE